MFQLGTCNQYVALKRKYGDLFSGRNHPWSLKEFGCLYAYDVIKQSGAKSVLEFGNGYNAGFSKLLRDEPLRYACLDNPASEKGIAGDTAKIETVEREVADNGHIYVRGYLGDRSPALDDGGFDLVFSISVIEHIGDEEMSVGVADAWRLLKPGGVLANTIDVYPASKKHTTWHKAALEQGFEIAKPYHPERWEFKGPSTTFLERQDVRYLMYRRNKVKDPISEGRPYRSQFATCLHYAVKPA